MRTSRMTVLVTAEEKSGIESDAERLGVSSGEYIRLAVSNFEKPAATEEAELAALVAEANTAIPQMRASIERITNRLDAMAEKDEAFLKKMGIVR